MSKNIISALSWANDNIGCNENQKPLHVHTQHISALSWANNKISYKTADKQWG